jgi:hypothetical protein
MLPGMIRAEDVGIVDNMDWLKFTNFKSLGGKAPTTISLTATFQRL